MAARKARKTTAKRSTGRKPARSGTKTSKRPKPKASKAEKAKKKKAVAPTRKKAPAKAAKPKKKVARAKPKPVRKPKPKAKPKAARPKPKAKPKARPKARPARKLKAKVQPKKRRKAVKKVVARKPARKTAPSRKKAVAKKPAKARKTVARRTQRLADLREQRRRRRLEEKAARKAAKADKLKAEKAKADKLKAEKRERIERLREAKRERIERIRAEKARKAEKLKAAKAAKAEKLAKAERLKAEKLEKVERLKAEKLEKVERLKAEKLAKAEKLKAEAQKSEAPPARSSKPGALPDRKSTPGGLKAQASKSVPAPKGPPAKGAKGKESERPKSPSQPPRTRVPLMRTPAVVIQKEPPRPPIEERAASVESRLREQPPEVLREYEERLFMSWIHHDSALEGVVYTFQELQMAVDPAITVVPDSSIQPICDEIRRHKQAIDFVCEQARLKEPVSSDLIKRIYLFLHPEEGDLKTVKYRKDIPQHRLYFHEYAAPDKIAYGVRQVVEWLNDPETARTRGALRIAARAHYDFIPHLPLPDRQREGGSPADELRAAARRLPAGDHPLDRASALLRGAQGLTALRAAHGDRGPRELGREHREVPQRTHHARARVRLLGLPLPFPSRAHGSAVETSAPYSPHQRALTGRSHRTERLTSGLHCGRFCPPPGGPRRLTGRRHHGS